MSKFSTTTNEHSLLSQLYKAHYSWLYYWLLKKMDGAAQAEDVLQDTFIKILRAGDTEPYRVCRRPTFLRECPNDKTKIYP